jgi:DNA-binding NtrC family response regulator
VLREALAGARLSVSMFASLSAASAGGRRKDYDLIICEAKAGGERSHLDTFQGCRSLQPGAEVILITAPGKEESAAEALAAGALACLTCPLRKEELLLQVGRALGNRDLARENRRFRQLLARGAGANELVGSSAAMVAVQKQITMASKSWSPVLIIGEAGTGKHLAARMIHDRGSRANQPFCVVHCGAMASSVLESELFGSAGKPSPEFAEEHHGLLARTSGGTVFLDDVEALSPSLQAKLARTLAERKISRRGDLRPVSLDVRFIAASRSPLGEAVKRGEFHEDLYDRLRVIEINLPPLRARSEDIPLLVSHFLASSAPQRARAYSVSTRALPALVGYRWPGNVRELESAIEVAMSRSPTGEITPDCLPPEVQAAVEGAPPYQNLFADLPSLEGLTKRYLQYVLRVTRGSKAKTAAVAGINRKTLYRMAERFKLQP